MSINPLPGFVFIQPLTSDSTLILPEEQTMIRTGIVKAIGGHTYFTSGHEYPSPVDVGQVVKFRYYEDEDVTDAQGEKGYLVDFQRIVGVDL